MENVQIASQGIIWMKIVSVRNYLIIAWMLISTDTVLIVKMAMISLMMECAKNKIMTIVMPMTIIVARAVQRFVKNVLKVII